MDLNLKTKLKPQYLRQPIKEADSIPVLLNENFISGDNGRYRKMYDWMSHGYDLAETAIGKLKYGNDINAMRAAIMSKLEWKDGLSVLYVSIGTGKNLQFIPASIDKKSLDLTGVDLSMGMLKKCRRKYRNNLSLSLVNCCAEDLPFRDDQFDIVFHVGGINFFNDKQRAIQEMLRVAKKGTKILISDETDYFIQSQFQKSSLSKKYFKDLTFDLSELEEMIPGNVSEKNTELLWGNRSYCITFRK